MNKTKKNLRPIVIPHNHHNISPLNISSNAIKVLHELKNAGFESYIVGGGVRDLLLGLHPKDFDIVTNAKPEQIRKLFKNCILIGRRFRLAHIRFGREIIEVATFRAQIEHDSDRYKLSEHGMLIRDNAYGKIEDDVWRRDITINALYYRIKDLAVIDYTGGIKDLKNKTIHIIGDPENRYREDPVRMLRVIRIAAKLDFKIAKKTSYPINSLAPLLTNISPARLFEENIKWFKSGKSFETFKLLQKYNLFNFLFAQVSASLCGKNGQFAIKMLHYGFINTDKRIKEGKIIIPAFLYAVLLWWPLQEQLELIITKNDKIGFIAAFEKAIHYVLHKQKTQTLLPQKIILTIKDIWLIQYKLTNTKKSKIHSILKHPKFRAAYDFLLLRADSGEDVKKAALWWTKLQELDENKRDSFIEHELNV